MNVSYALSAIAGILLVLNACATNQRLSPATAPATELAGTSWRLVQFEGGDGQILKPDDRSKYTVQFNGDGSISVRLDCNRGRGTWKTAEPPQLELGPLALTRAMCADMTLHDQVAKQWIFVRSYLLRDTHLFLSLMADGGIYEFEPAKAEGS